MHTFSIDITNLGSALLLGLKKPGVLKLCNLINRDSAFFVTHNNTSIKHEH